MDAVIKRVLKAMTDEKVNYGAILKCVNFETAFFLYWKNCKKIQEAKIASFLHKEKTYL